MYNSRLKLNALEMLGVIGKVSKELVQSKSKDIVNQFDGID